MACVLVLFAYWLCSTLHITKQKCIDVCASGPYELGKESFTRWKMRHTLWTGNERGCKLARCIPYGLYHGMRASYQTPLERSAWGSVLLLRTPFAVGCIEIQVTFPTLAFHKKMNKKVSQLWKAVLAPNKSQNTLLAEHASHLVPSTFEPVDQLLHSSCLASHLLHCSGTANG